MSETAEKTDPALWEKVKAEVTAGAKGGRKGQWSARKAQIAVAVYKERGGGYRGEREPDNSLHQWSEEDWGTKSGEDSGKTGERYLPKKARESLTDEEYAASTAKKRADTRKGKQFSKQPKAAAEKAAAAREDGKSAKASGKGGSKGSGKGGGKSETTKAELMRKARAQNVPGRSRMSKAQLEHAVHA